MNITSVQRICVAYESGFGRAQSKSDLAQPYAAGTPEAEAYLLGHQRGLATKGEEVPEHIGGVAIETVPETDELDGLWGVGLHTHLPMCDLVLHFGSVEEAQAARAKIYERFGLPSRSEVKP